MEEGQERAMIKEEEARYAGEVGGLRHKLAPVYASSKRVCMTLPLKSHPLKGVFLPALAK